MLINTQNKARERQMEAKNGLLKPGLDLIRTGPNSHLVCKSSCNLWHCPGFSNHVDSTLFGKNPCTLECI